MTSTSPEANKHYHIWHFLDNIAACIPANVYWKDINGVYQGCNDRMANALGLPKSEIIGKTDNAFIKILGSKKSINTYGKQDKDILKEGIPKLNLEGPTLYLPQEKVIHQLTNKIPLRDTNDQIIGLLGISIDVTEGKTAQEILSDANKKSLGFFADLSKEVFGNSSPSYNTAEEYASAVFFYLENIISHMPGNIYWTDKNSVYLGCNDNVTKMLGLKSHKDIVGITYADMARLGGWTEGQGESFRKDDQEVMRTGKPKLNVEEPPITDSKGNIIYFLTSRVPLRDKNNKVVGILGISIDISELKKAQFALGEAKEKAEAANVAKDAFMENMSHDFKTPLNGIYGVVQLLVNRIDEFPDDIKELVHVQEKSTLRLAKLVESILDFSKIYSGTLEIVQEELNLFDIIESVVHNLSFQLKNKPVDILIYYPPEVPRHLISDTHCITSIVLNLMSNAIKFTDEGHVAISVNIASKEGDNVILEIEVTDTGEGIPEDKYKEIFERFHRLELSNKGLKEGHGIGLSVVKELVDKLNGQIDVQSELGKGTKFTTQLPFQVHSMSFFVSEWEKLHPTVHILVVSDKVTSTDIQFNQFEQAFVSKTDSSSLINKLEQAIKDKKPFQVLIIDDEIKTDPLALINTLHKDKKFSGLMKLLSLQPKQDRDKKWYDTAREMGCFDFIKKPVLPSELDKKMVEAWEKWEKNDPNKEPPA